MNSTAVSRTATVEACENALDVALGSTLRYTSQGAQDEEISDLRRLVLTFACEDANSAHAIAVQLPSFLQNMSIDATRRWMLTGVRLHPNDPVMRLSYFQLQDPRSVETMRREACAPGLAPALPSLNYFLEALTSRRMRVQGQQLDRLNAPPQRPILTSRHLLLPTHVPLVDAPEPTKLLYASVAHAAAHLRYSPVALPADRLKPMAIAVVSAVEDARVERLLIQECPGLRGWFAEQLQRALQADDLSFSALISRVNYALIEPNYHDGNYWVIKARTLFEACTDKLDQYAAFREISSILANDLGQMRVRFQPQLYVVPAMYRDDNTFLWNFPEPDASEQPQNLAFEMSVIPAGQPAQTREREAQPQEEQEVRRVQYPEWDYRLGLLRGSWCTVIERLSQLRNETRPMRPPRSFFDLKLKPRVTLTRSMRLRRQTEGENLDLDAAVEHVIDRRGGRMPEHRVFIRPGGAVRTMSILLLLDMSMSSGDRVMESGESILDLEKDAALMLAHAALTAGHRIAVHGFASNTREAVNYYRLLDFGMPLNEASESAIRSATPRYSTRMGAALRHAANLMSSEPTDRRAVVVITDGVPSDIDVFDAQYLVHDARVAVIEARRNNVLTAGIAIGAGPADYMQRIVGQQYCRTASDPHTLPSQLAALYARISD